MNCKNCGAELQEGERICHACGSAAEMSPEEPAAEQNVFVPTGQAVENTPSQPPKTQKQKKKRGPLIAATICLIAVLAVGVSAFAAREQIGNFIKKSFSDPAEYYEYVESKNTKKSTDVLTSLYEQYTEQLSGSSREFACEVEIKPTLQTMLAALPVQLSGLENIRIEGVSCNDGPLSSSQAQIKLNDTDVLSTNLYLNTEERKYYIQIPEISETYLDYSSILENPDDSGTADPFGLLNNLRENLPKTATVQTLLDRYSKLFIEGHGAVTKSDTTASLEGISQKCTKLTVTYNAESAKLLLEKLIQTAKEDNELKEVLTSLGDEDIYNSFLQSLEETNTDNIDTESEKILTMDVLIDNRGDIIGRTLSTDNIEKNNTKTLLSYLQVQEGKDFRYNFTLYSGNLSALTDDDLEASEDTVFITGSGTLAKKKLNGTYTVGSRISDADTQEALQNYVTDMENLVTIEIQDYDLKKASQGNGSGTVLLSSDSIPAIANYALSFKTDSGKDSSDLDITVICNEDELCTISTTSKKAEVTLDTKPADDAVFYDAAGLNNSGESYAPDFDPEAFLKDILEKSGITMDTTYLSYLFAPAYQTYEDYELYDDYENYGLSDNDFED